MAFDSTRVYCSTAAEVAAKCGRVVTRTHTMQYSRTQYRFYRARARFHFTRHAVADETRLKSQEVGRSQLTYRHFVRVCERVGPLRSRVEYSTGRTSIERIFPNSDSDVLNRRRRTPRPSNEPETTKTHGRGKGKREPAVVPTFQCQGVANNAGDPSYGPVQRYA